MHIKNRSPLHKADPLPRDVTPLMCRLPERLLKKTYSPTPTNGLDSDRVDLVHRFSVRFHHPAHASSKTTRRMSRTCKRHSTHALFRASGEFRERTRKAMAPPIEAPQASFPLKTSCEESSNRLLRIQTMIVQLQLLDYVPHASMASACVQTPFMFLLWHTQGRKDELTSCRGAVKSAWQKPSSETQRRKSRAAKRVSDRHVVWGRQSSPILEVRPGNRQGW